MKHRIFVISIIALLLVVLLPVASSGLVDADIVHAQGDGGDITETLDNEASLGSNLSLTLSPYNPPIVVPASGGTFQYLIDVKNLKTTAATFDIWTSITLPNGSTINPASEPIRARTPGGWSVSRDDLTQAIPADYPSGDYIYHAYVGRFPDVIKATDSFTFEKLASGGWFSQSSGTSDWLFDIHFADANNGWAVGQTNEIVHTTNGGDTWTAQTTPVFVNLWSVFAVDADNAWAGGSGSGPVLLYTNDGGANWVQQNAGGSYSWNGIYFLDENNGWIVGGKPFDFTASRRIIKHTIDGGATWETQYSVSNESPLQGVYFLDANNGWAVGEGTGILHTSDGGATWAYQTTGTIEYFDDVHFVNANNGWAVGRDGTVVSTTNGGDTWSVVNLGGQYDLTGLDFADANNGWISGINQNSSQAVIFHTADGGATWNEQDPGPTTILYNVTFVDANNGWAAGDNGTIVHTDTGGN